MWREDTFQASCVNLKKRTNHFLRFLGVCLGSGIPQEFGLKLESYTLLRKTNQIYTGLASGAGALAKRIG